MSGCESPPANLRRTKVSQILHGLASDPLTGLLFVAAPCRYPPPFLLLFRIPLRDSSPPAVTPVKVCVPQSQSVVAIFYYWRCTEARYERARRCQTPATITLKLGAFFCDIRRIILRITVPPTGISASKSSM
ncbi:hypothetical protein BDQ94DRAFT_163814 [Aspergillus welwitschiae]|uniref:Uncharacterized protein n=1 Tax=Aspergillus welwitschiae TaxID=1341132 RepID=A0A3F3PLJ6_9EURO|nr:hypothetical protein BDQ94DRAFT_163814 [Aspergillus welwitschiae]RDH27226.1 hypothetical protein BDQ94DRAFT_163814 [Aspergillus welwitschiae]